MGQVIALAAAGSFQPPCPLSAEHDLVGFECGEEALDAWLSRHALRNQESGASRTYVATRGGAVVGYYCLAVGAVARVEGTKTLQRNMPDPIPVMVLGRLAVHLTCKGLGIGTGMLRDAALRTLQVSQTAGMAALLVHARHEKAAAFYEHHGFRRSPVRPLTLMLSMREMKRGLAGA